jgi:hypothetical protein
MLSMEYIKQTEQNNNSHTAKIITLEEQNSSCAVGPPLTHTGKNELQPLYESKRSHTLTTYPQHSSMSDT